MYSKHQLHTMISRCLRLKEKVGIRPVLKEEKSSIIPWDSNMESTSEHKTLHLAVLCLGIVAMDITCSLSFRWEQRMTSFWHNWIITEEENERGMEKTRPKLVGLNDQLTCRLCSGYLIDATTITDCIHSCKFFIIIFHSMTLMQELISILKHLNIWLSLMLAFAVPLYCPCTDIAQYL